MSWWTLRGKQKEVGNNIMLRTLNQLQANLPASVFPVQDRCYTKNRVRYGVAPVVVL